MSHVKPVTAYQWTCDDCHDVGYERTAADALEQLEIHQEDYHAAAALDVADELVTFDGSRLP